MRSHKLIISRYIYPKMHITLYICIYLWFYVSKNNDLFLCPYICVLMCILFLIISFIFLEEFLFFSFFLSFCFWYFLFFFFSLLFLIWQWFQYLIFIIILFHMMFRSSLFCHKMNHGLCLVYSCCTRGIGNILLYEMAIDFYNFYSAPKGALIFSISFQFGVF